MPDTAVAATATTTATQVTRPLRLQPTAPMFIRGVGTAVPDTRYTKTDCLQAFEQSDWFGRLDARAHFIARTVLQRDNGIDARRLAVDGLAEVFTDRKSVV